MSDTYMKQDLKIVSLLAQQILQYMGICASVSEGNIKDSDSDVTEVDSESYNSYSEGEIVENGTTASTRDAARDGKDDIMSPTRNVAEEEEDARSGSDKVVRFSTNFYEKDVLREIFSEECLLEKSRKSFNADMRMFAIMFEGTGSTDKDEMNPK